MDKDERYCKICYSEAAKYVCPRCGIPYCSIKCYKDVDKHLKCSEDFYRRCIEENLSGGGTSDSDKEQSAVKMKEILERFHNQDQNPEQGCDENMTINSDGSESSEGEEENDEETLDSDDDEPLEKRLENIDLDESEKIWDLLTEDEKADFKRMVEATEAQGVEAVAEPWYPGRKLIQDLSSSSSSSSPHSRSAPPPPPPPHSPPTSKVTSKSEAFIASNTTRSAGGGDGGGDGGGSLSTTGGTQPKKRKINSGVSFKTSPKK